MAWSTPRTWVTGETPNATIMNTHLRDQFTFFADEPKELHVEKTVSQSLSSGSMHNITFQSEIRNVGFSFSSGQSTFTIPEDGIWALSYTGQFQGDVGEPGGVTLEVNGTRIMACGGEVPVFNEGNQKTTSVAMFLASSSTVTTQAVQNSGSNMDLQLSTSVAPTRFFAVQVQRTV